SGCWILPQPEQARLHWNSGSSSTISGNFSRLARRWRIRYQPMRVLCLTFAAIGRTLARRVPVLNRDRRNLSQRLRRGERSADRLNAEQLVAGTVEHDAHDRERAP